VSSADPSSQPTAVANFTGGLVLFEEAKFSETTEPTPIATTNDPKEPSMFKSFTLPSGTAAVQSTVENPSHALVIIPDVFGLRPLYAEHTKRLSQENNWNVCCFELYADLRHLTTLDERFGNAYKLEDDRILGDAVDAANLMTTDLGLDIPVGITGFCMGGMYTSKSLSTGRFARGVSFYGMIDIPDDWKSPTQGEPLDHIAQGDPSTLLAIIAEDDHWTPPEKVDKLRAAGVPIANFEGCEHGFVHDPDRDDHHPEQAAKAWRTAIEFLSGAPA